MRNYTDSCVRNFEYSGILFRLGKEDGIFPKFVNPIPAAGFDVCSYKGMAIHSSL